MAQEYWLLYKKRTSEFQDLMSNTYSNIPAITFNPVSIIIDIDIALITKGLLITGAGTKYVKQNNFYSKIPEIVKRQLLDGNVYIDPVVVENTYVHGGELIKEQIVQFDMFSIDDVPLVEYDQRGNITRIQLQGEGVSKEFYKDEKGIVRVSYTYEDGRATEDSVYIPGVIPVIEFPGVKTDAEDNVSRIEGISQLLIDINTDKSKLDNIFAIHADPTLIGNVNFEDDSDNTDALSRKAGEYNYLETPEGGKLYFLEMQGGVVKYLADEKDKKKKELTLEYPELLLNEIASGSSMSGYAIYLKILNLVSIIESYRANLVNGLEQLFEIATLLDAGVKNDTHISLDPVVKYNENDRINQIVSSKTNELIDHKTAVNLTAQLFGLEADIIWDNITKQEVKAADGSYMNQSIPNPETSKQDTQL